MSWFRGPSKADPGAKIWEQVVYLRRDSRKNGEGVGKSQREGRKTTPGSTNEVPDVGNWDPQKDWLESSLVPHRCGILPALPAPERSCGHRMSSSKEVQVKQDANHMRAACPPEAAGGFQVAQAIWAGHLFASA